MKPINLSKTKNVQSSLKIKFVFIWFSLHNLTHLGFIIYRNKKWKSIALVWNRGAWWSQIYWNTIYGPNTRRRSHISWGFNISFNISVKSPSFYCSQQKFFFQVLTLVSWKMQHFFRCWKSSPQCSETLLLTFSPLFPYSWSFLGPCALVPGSEVCSIRTAVCAILWVPPRNWGQGRGEVWSAGCRPGQEKPVRDP